MSIMEKKRDKERLDRYAAMLAALDCEDLEVRCRRYRRRAALRRVMSVAVLMLAVVLMAGSMGSAVAGQLSAEGALPVDKAAASVHLILASL